MSAISSHTDDCARPAAGQRKAKLCALTWAIARQLAVTALLASAALSAIAPAADAQQLANPQAPGPMVRQLKPGQKPPAANPTKPPAAKPAKPAAKAKSKSQTINVLAHIDPTRDAVHPSWRFVDGALYVDRAMMSPLELPLAVPKAYTLTLQLARLDGTEYVAIGLPIGDRLPQVCLDSGGEVSGLSMIDGNQYRFNKTKSVGSQLLPLGQTCEIVCEVSPGKIKVTCDGRTVVDWSGDVNRLSADTQVRNVRGDRIYLASYQVAMRISGITLDVSPTAATGDVPNPADGANAIRRRARVVPAPPPANRAAIPTADAQRENRKLILDLYKDDLARVRKTGAADFPKTLLNSAEETTNDPAARYVLINLARELSAAAGDMTTTLDAADQLAAAYDIDPLQSRLQAAKTVVAAKTAPDAAPVAVQSMLDLADDCRAASEFDGAAQAIKVARAIALAVKDAELGKAANLRAKEIAALAKRFAAVKPQLAALKRDPADPVANLAVGRWYCFASLDWDRGLPLLAAGGDADLKALAARDLSKPTAAADQTSLGDGWWDLAQKQTDESMKQAILGRAAHWYEQAEPNLQGLAQLKVQQRLKACKP